MNDPRIHFWCPICSTRMGTPAENAGATVECASCHTRLTVPDDTVPGEVVEAEEAPVRFRSQRGAEETEMDMTPMVDVTFLLLIFFMVSAAFTLQKSFQVPTPQDEQPSTNVVQREDDGTITVRIDEYNTFHVSAPGWGEEQEAPGEIELLRKLREAKQGDGSGYAPNRLVVVAHVEATHEYVVMALDAGTEIQMDQVMLRTVEDDS